MLFVVKVVMELCQTVHYISRQNGGLGIEQNIVTMCRIEIIFSTKRSERIVKNYLNKANMKDWNERDLI